MQQILQNIRMNFARIFEMSPKTHPKIFACSIEYPTNMSSRWETQLQCSVAANYEILCELYNYSCDDGAMVVSRRASALSHETSPAKLHTTNQISMLQKGADCTNVPNVFELVNMRSGKSTAES